MIINRIQAGSTYGKDTHTWPIFEKIYYKYLNKLKSAGVNGISYDLFARNCTFCQVTNDINPNTKAMINLDAEIFIKNTKSNQANLIIFDPPFSNRQAKDKYSTSNLYSAESKKISNICNEFERVLNPGGYVIKCGYNSTNLKNLKLIEMVVINFGGSRNDVIITIHQKQNKILRDFI